MKFVKFVLAAALLAAPMALVSAVPAHAQIYAANNLSGQWQGAYAGEGNQQTFFTVAIDQIGSNFVGAMAENNSFADAPVVFLVSDIEGRIANGRVSFVKTYVDGDAGVTHSVTYEGRVTSNGRRIRGTWNAGGLTGVFEMVR